MASSITTLLIDPSIIASWYQMKQDIDFPMPGVGMPASVTSPHQVIDARNVSAQPVLLNGAIEGHVLVKNINNALPLKKPRMISIFGYSAKAPDQVNPGGGGVADPWIFGSIPVDPQEVARGFLGIGGSISGIAFNGTMISGGGSGATSPPYIISPFEAIKMQAYEDGSAVYWDFISGTPNVEPASDVCLVFGNAWASESYDRPSIHDDYTDNLIKTVASKCNNTIVVLHNAGIRVVDPWAENPNVTAIIFAHLPGQDTGKAITAILYGKANPSGKLPYTVAKQDTDYPGLNPDLPAGIYKNFPQSDFAEGIYVDYRHFDAKNIAPRFEFGFGLSYTTFSYANLSISPVRNASTAAYPSGAVVTGGQADLWDVLIRVSADVQNTGNLSGAEVAQLYVGIPNAPARQLRGFEKPSLNASETATVRFELTRRDLSVWDVVAQRWLLQAGTYGVFVGASSRILPLGGNITIAN
jgi:beta-glucosidase